ncbi:MAG: transposase [Spirosoma sp.]|nr:transposase [Spirosoma sp.]
MLNANTFSSLAHVLRTVDTWLVEYNTERPKQALKFMTPTVGRSYLCFRLRLSEKVQFLTKT